MPAALRVRFLRTACSACWRLGLAWLVVSRMVFRAQGESPAPLSGQTREARLTESCNEVRSDNYVWRASLRVALTNDFHLNGDSPRPTRRSPLPLAARPVPTRRRSVPTGNTTAPTGNATGRLGPFPKGDWGLHTGDSGDRRRLAEPTGRQGRQLAGASRRTGGRLASPTGPLPFGEATSPGATRPRDLRPPGPTRPRATTACAATSSAVPSYS